MIPLLLFIIIVGFIHPTKVRSEDKNPHDDGKYKRYREETLRHFKPGTPRVSPVNCATAPFHEVQVGPNTGSFSNNSLDLTWYEAICCCRQRRQHLTSPASEEDLTKVYTAVKGHRYIGWSDVSRIGTGPWENFLPGRTIPQPPGPIYSQVDDHPGGCMELGPEINDKPTMTFNYIELKPGTIADQCNTRFDEHVLCEGRVNLAESLKDQCFENGQACGRENIIIYQTTGSCPPDAKFVPPSTTAATTAATTAETTPATTAAFSTTKPTRRRSTTLRTKRPRQNLTCEEENHAAKCNANVPDFEDWNL